MERYEHKVLEQKWREKWNASDVYKTTEDLEKKKFYILDMFPYPSGVGLHVGHPKGFIATDVISRMKKMQDFNVLHPMGWDAFGLPAEQYALTHKVHPRIAVDKNIATYKKQLESISLNYDWDREFSTTDPAFYKWTQWTFIQMYKKGLVFQSNEPINWCPSCKTGLANEDLEDGMCERCGSVIEKKKIPQWVIKITDYADRMLADLDKLEWQEHIKELQRNWIGRSEGAEILFVVKGTNEKIAVFTTRPDTLFGATYMVLAPEHGLIENEELKIENIKEVRQYQSATQKKTEIERTAEGREKTGIKLEGVNAINPVNGSEIPIYIADYVLADYGTGAIMAVPAHDQRDWEFAKKYDIEIIDVIAGRTHDDAAFVSGGKLINSGDFDGMESEEVKKKITQKVEGKMTVSYKLRDWVFSRQRYWGEPIPLIHCAVCGVVPVPENELPLTLPEVENYEPTGTGESPLASIESWVNVACPQCDAPAKRETNTMPQWAGSSWYHLRYIDPKNSDALVDKNKDAYWSPVDFYVGGAEHATRHLIYARFWHKFLFDIGAVTYDEPYSKLQTVGLILAEDGRKMSKRWNNVVNPDDIIERFGCDTFRLYEMFMGPFDAAIAWNTEGLIGPRKFLERIWKIYHSGLIGTTSTSIEKLLHKTIKKVGEDIGHMKYNTAIAAMMIFVNELEKDRAISENDFGHFLKILSPFSPHITQELWEKMGHETFLMEQKWPQYDARHLIDDEIELVVQINGRVRDKFMVVKDITEELAKDKALASEKVQKYIKNQEIRKIIFVKGKLISIVV